MSEVLTLCPCCYVSMLLMIASPAKSPFLGQIGFDKSHQKRILLNYNNRSYGKKQTKTKHFWSQHV